MCVAHLVRMIVLGEQKRKREKTTVQLIGSCDSAVRVKVGRYHLPLTQSVLECFRFGFYSYYGMPHTFGNFSWYSMNATSIPFN